MEKNSRLERVSDTQLKKFMKYFNDLDVVFNNAAYLTIDEFISEVKYDDKLYKKLVAPLGVNKLSRLDFEYLYYIFKYNDASNPPDVIDRPELNSKNVCYISRETHYLEFRREGEIITYIDNDIDSSYLEELRQNDQIYPWDWDVEDEDVIDSDIDDDWFEIDC